MTMAANYSDLAGASVLITGGGSGIGAALTEGFARQGSQVAFIDVATGESEALLDRLEREGLPRPLFFQADLRDVGALRAAATEAALAHGPVGVLVNNAARDDRHRIEDMTVEAWDANHAVNLRHQFFAVQAVVEGMKAAGKGAIVNFSSTAYMINNPGMPAYTAAKAGIVGLTKGLAGDLGPFGIRVNAIAPGWVMTERQRSLWVTEEGLKSHIARQCLKFELQAEDMVGPCLFLASDAARAVTAQVLIADGGTL
ncbi:MAG: SDR family oxidoreductase [Rhizobiaceae bacterium]|nr:SDR family oxidoreductase [Rhizobiaceae bacterium]MCV0405982.1 SDR family oxidoreductase [Rhizobiaceae bacterium]